MARLGDAVRDLTGHRAEQIVELFALRGRHLGFGQYVRRGFVLLTMLETRLDADPVEQAPQKRRFRAQTREPDRAQGLQPDLVKRGGEIIGPRAAAEFAEALGEGDRELAAGAERLDRVAQLLDLGEPERITVDMGIEAADARIFGGALDRIEKAAHRLFAAGEQLAHLVLAWAFEEVAAELGGQDDRFRQGRPARRDAPDRDPGAKDHERGDNADRGKDTQHNATHDESTRSCNDDRRAWRGAPDLSKDASA